MINLRQGSHAYLLLRLLAVTGEIPMKIVRMLGSERSWKVLIYKMNTVQKVRITDTDERFECRLLTIGGKGRLKTIRLHKAALPILEKSGVDFASKTEGIMHACGHDGHMAILLGLASFLKEVKTVLEKNKQERHLRGGAATKQKFLKIILKISKILSPS